MKKEEVTWKGKKRRRFRLDGNAALMWCYPPTVVAVIASGSSDPQFDT